MVSKLFAIATVELDAPVNDDVDDLRWAEPTPEFAALREWPDEPGLAERANRLADRHCC